MARETWVQFQVELYHRLKKWYLIPPCLTLSIIRYESWVKWSNPGKGVAPSPVSWCSSSRKGSLRITLDYGCQLFWPIDSTLSSTTSPGQSGPGSYGNEWVDSHSPKPQGWSLIIRQFSVIYRILVRGCLTLPQRCSKYKRLYIGLLKILWTPKIRWARKFW